MNARVATLILSISFSISALFMFLVGSISIGLMFASVGALYAVFYFKSKRRNKQASDSK